MQICVACDYSSLPVTNADCVWSVIAGSLPVTNADVWYVIAGSLPVTNADVCGL